LSTYRLAIDQTTQTIDRRSKHFRNLIVAVTFVGLGSTLWAGIAWSWLPLTGIFLLVPFCGLYLFIDGKLLDHWRQELFSVWEKGEIDFQALHDAVISISTLPKDSVLGMLDTLPSAGDLVAEQGISTSTRKAVAAVVTTINTCRSDAIALTAAGYTITGCVIIAAIAFWQWQPLLGLFVVGLPLLLQKWIRAKRLKSARERLRAAQNVSDFSLEKFMNIVSEIHWTPISTSEKKTIMSGP